MVAAYESALEEFEDRLLKVNPTRKPRPPRHCWWVRTAAWKIERSRPFGHFITLTLTLNAALLCCVHAGESETWDTVQEIGNCLFTAMFVFECVVKLISNQWRYFSKPGNVFDFAVTGVGVWDATTSVISHSICQKNGGVATYRLIRAGRVFRLTRLLKLVPELYVLYISSIHPLPQLMNVCFFMVLVYFTAGNLCVQLFSSIEYGTEETTTALNDHINFETIPRAMKTLIYISTGENWALIYLACAEQVPVGANVAFWRVSVALFFFLFVITMQFLIINIFVMVSSPPSLASLARSPKRTQTRV